MGITITHHDQASRFEASVDGVAAGYLEYRLRGATMAILHTIVDPAFGRKGVGSALVAYTLDWASGQDLGVLPYCSFAATYIRRHPEYLGNVPADRRVDFGLPASTDTGS